MPIYKMRNLGKYGVITDIPAYDLPDEGWTMANNVRFVANRFEKIGGYTPFLNPPDDGGTVLTFTQEPETDSLLYGTERNLYKYQGNGVINISNDKHKDDYHADPSNPWDYTILSNVVVFNNGIDNPQAWLKSDPTVKVIDLPGWGVHRAGQIKARDWRCLKMRSYKNYLVALNTWEDEHGDGTGNDRNFPQRVRWSNVSYIDALPADWNDNGAGTTAGTASDGGYNDLSDCDGIIQDGRPMRDAFMIYTTKEVYVMDFTGGDLMFNFRKLFPNSGILAPNCVCEFEGYQHFVVSEDDIYIHDGSIRTSIATDVVKEYLLGQITSTNYKATKVFAYPQRKEIWVTYTTTTTEAGETDNYACNKAAIWNWKTGQWSFTDLPNVYWMESIVSPEGDFREWRNPEGTKTMNPVTKIILDSPIYSLPLDKTFRLDLIYKPGEGLSRFQKLKWTTTNPNIFDVSQVDPYDWSLTLKPKATGKAFISVVVVDIDPITKVETPSKDLNLMDSYEIEVTGRGTEVGDRHQPSDPDKDSDPSEPKPPYRPDQQTTYPDPDNQWETFDPDTGDALVTIHSSESWEQRGVSFSRRTFAASSNDTSFYSMDTGTVQTRYHPLSSVSVPVLAEISRYGIAMPNVEDSLGRHKTWRTIYPLMTGKGTLRFIVGGAEDAYTSPVYSDSAYFTIGQQYKVDCFVNNKFLALTIRDEGEGEWSISGFDIDFFIGGLR